MASLRQLGSDAHNAKSKSTDAATQKLCDVVADACRYIEHLEQKVDSAEKAIQSLHSEIAQLRKKS